MPQRTDVFDLPRLGLTSGEGRRLDLHVGLEPFSFGGQSYAAEPDVVPVRVDVSRTTGNGWALRLREAGMIKSSPGRIIAEGTDWRAFNELKRELKS